MRIATDFTHCIVCLTNEVGDWEHILPRSVGGRLEAELLCNSCNHKFGSKFVGQLNQDPTIRYAYEHLREQIPFLYNKSQAKATWVGNTSDGSIIRLSNAAGKPRILPVRQADGSLIMDTDEAASALVIKLTKAKLTSEEVANYQNRFATLPEDELLLLPTGEIFVKRTLPRFYPETTTYHVTKQLPALIAYEFLALLIGDAIYHEYFQPVRDYISEGIATDVLLIRPLHAEKYSPYHVIDLDTTLNTTTINIRLFRAIIFSVTFIGLPYSGPNVVYQEDLEDRKSPIALSKDAAARGEFYEYG